MILADSAFLMTMRHFEACGVLDDDMLFWGNQHFKIAPASTLAFPTKEVQELHYNAFGVVLETHFMGLWGVDSPLSGPLNARCSAKNQLGFSLRQFLGAIGHRNYVLYYQAWRDLQPEFNPIFLKLIQSINGKRHSPAHHPKNTRGALLNSLRIFFPNAEIKLKKGGLNWLPALQTRRLGEKILLGKNACLGMRTYHYGKSFEIVIALNKDEKDVLRSDKKNLFSAIRGVISRDVTITLIFRVPVAQEKNVLGSSNLRAGFSSWLGKRAFYEVRHRIE